MITPDTLSTALALAKPGDRLTLSGEFPAMRLRGDRLAAGLTLDLAKAEIAGPWIATGMADLTILGGHWRGCGVRFDGCGGVTVIGGLYEGPGADDAALAVGYGVQTLGSNRVAVRGVRAIGYKGGVVIARADGFDVADCVMERMGSDGIQAAESRRGRIAGNVVHGSRLPPGSQSHPDGIQLWSRPTSPPTADIVIERNLLVGPMQGVFLGNHVRAGVDDGGFDQVVIRDNEIVAGFPHGLCVTDGRGVTVTGNRVRTLTGARFRASINLVRCAGVIRSGNTVAAGAGKPSADDPR